MLIKQLSWKRIAYIFIFTILKVPSLSEIHFPSHQAIFII